MSTAERMPYVNKAIDTALTQIDIYDTNKFSVARNKLRDGDQFPEHFGRNKIYPALIQNSYTVWLANGQRLFFAGIIGVGTYEIEQVFIDNTPIEDYEGSVYHITNPGEIDAETDPLFYVHDIVWTCNEVDNITLNTNDVGFIISAPFTKIYAFGFNVEFPEGTGDGVHLTFYCVGVDDNGEQTTDYYFFNSINISGSSVPKYLSYKFSLSNAIESQGPIPNRCKFYIHISDSSVKTVLTELYGYGPRHDDYGDVTIITCMLKAYDKMNGDAASKLNVVATRKLGVVSETGIGETLTSTRSIIDAVAHLITAGNCGNQSSSIIDWEALSALKAILDEDEYFFDYSFTNKLSVMDAVEIAAKCGKCVPFMDSGLFSMKQDILQETPSCLFTYDNIKDLKISAKPHTADDHTSTKITYLDNTTWKEEIVSCYEGEGDPDYNPNEVTLYGCTDRQIAYEIGMYYYWREQLERISVEFSSDLIAFIPQILDKVLIPNKMSNFGSSGLIVDVNDTTIILSEPVDFNGEESGILYVSLADGTVGGPYTVGPTDYSHIITGTIPVYKTLNFDGLKATRYLFGVSSDDALFIRIDAINPSSRDEIQITGTVINDDVYDYPGAVSEIGEPPGSVALLVSINLIYTGESEEGAHEFELTWEGSAATVLIQLDEGSGYEILVDDYSSHKYTFESTVNGITVSVTPYDGVDLVTTEAQEIEWSYEEEIGPVENLTFPSLSNISNVRTTEFTDDATSIVEWGIGQEQEGALVYTADNPPTGDDDYTITDHNKIVLNPTKWQESIEANILGLLNVDTRQGA